MLVIDLGYAVGVLPKLIIIIIIAMSRAHANK